MHITKEDLKDLKFIPLHDAMLCANCELVSDSRESYCAACGSKALLSLSRLLGGTVITASNQSTFFDELEREMEDSLETV